MDRYTAQEVARRGKVLYERRICPEVEHEHEGRFLVVDVESGEYALADDELAAFDLAREKTLEGVSAYSRYARATARHTPSDNTQSAPIRV